MPDRHASAARAGPPPANPGPGPESDPESDPGPDPGPDPREARVSVLLPLPLAGAYD